jgi:flagellar hook-basal body complex protein FliE
MAINAIAGAAAQIATLPTLPATGQIGWTGGTGATGPAGAAGHAVAEGVAGAAGAAAGAGTQSFGQTLTKALDGLSGMQTKADGLAVQAATGDLTNVHDYMIAATEASLATELTVAVRNKAVEAFNQIMNMPV